MTEANAKTMSDGASQPNDSNGLDSEDLTGRKVANCQVLQKLGQGAMGAVYLAEQISLRRTVALKVLDSRFSRDLTYIERFEREAQAAARLGHFNIVQVFDFGREGDIYYILSEYVDGGNVQDLIEKEGIVSPAQAVGIVLQACRGLAAAQEHQIVHRDIKPENLMLTKAGAVKIADFGLAKVVNDNAAVTQAGIIVGTPFYMSPEQAKGLPLDGRSDLYSLGVTFFHMITGQIPFDADSVIGVLLKQISAERPDPVAINPSLPAAFGPLVMRMMSRSAENRYQGAGELIPTLQQIQHDLEAGNVSVPPPAKGVSQERMSRYKALPRNQILQMALRDVDPKVTARMVQHVKGDTGVFVQSDDLYPENSILELQFTVPGQEMLYVALGLVRWSSSMPGHTGMGVTFLKVNRVPKTSLERSKSQRLKAVSPNAAAPTPAPMSRGTDVTEVPSEKLSPDKIIQLLTQSQTHSRLLRYYYANTGQVVQIGQVASALGVGLRLMDDPLRDFERFGLIERRSGGLLNLVWTEDENLQQEIVNWIRQYGLL